MSDSTKDIVVAVAPGTGRIARRLGALLFDPTGENAELMAGFDQAHDDQAAITVVKQHLIDAEFEVAPLVVIDWRGDAIGLLVFGDAVVHSSAAAAPMISGAGSGTWIERQLGALELGDAAQAQVWCGDESDQATDLRLGIARAGGVKLTMARTVPGTGASEPADGSPAAATPATSDTSQLPRAQADLPAPPPASDEERFTPLPSTSPPTAATMSAPEPSGALDDPLVHTNGSAALPSSQPGFVAEPGGIEWTNTDPAAAGAVAVAADPFAEEVSLGTPPTAQADVFEDAATTPLDGFEGADDSPQPTGRLVEALACENGHQNPPLDRLCRTCALEIDPETPVMAIAQPSLGFVRFPDGTGVEIDKKHVIGRKPPIGLADTQPVIVDHAEVSRSHVEITLDGWSVLVTDLGSRNGTWVIPPSDPTPIQLEGHVPYVLEHGTTVHLGGPEASFTYDFGVD